MASVFLLPSTTFSPGVDAPPLCWCWLSLVTSWVLSRWSPGHQWSMLIFVIPHTLASRLFACCDCRWSCVSEECAKPSLWDPWQNPCVVTLSPLAPKKQCVENQREAGFCAIIVLSLTFLCHCLVTDVISSWLRAQNGKLFPIVSKK